MMSSSWSLLENATPVSIDTLVADMVNLREEFEERAGIMEYSGNLSRAHAECLALLDVLQRHPTALMASK